MIIFLTWSVCVLSAILLAILIAIFIRKRNVEKKQRAQIRATERREDSKDTADAKKRWYSSSWEFTKKFAAGKLGTGVLFLIGLFFLLSIISILIGWYIQIANTPASAKYGAGPAIENIHQMRVYANEWKKLPITTCIGLHTDVSPGDECFIFRTVIDSSGREKSIDPEPYSTSAVVTPKAFDAIYFKATKASSGNLADGVQVRWWNQ